MAAVPALNEAAARPALAESRIARTPTILQMEAAECGAAALAMVLAHHGRWVPLEQMRVDCGVNRDGSKASGLIRAARGHGLVARGFRKEPRELAQLPLPAIVFVNFNHFVVLEGFRDGCAWLNDPARGRRRVPAAEFDQAFTGVVLTFERGEDFVPGGEAPSAWRALRGHMEGFRGPIAAAFSLGLLLVVPGLMLPWLLGRFVDEVLVSHLPGSAVPLLVGLALAALARSVLLALQARLLLDSFGRAARASAHRLVEHALALPMAFYLQRSPGELAARVDLNERTAELISQDVARMALDLLTASFFFVLMARLHGGITLAVAACVAVELVAWRALGQRTYEVSQELSVQGGKLAAVATGGLANIESVKAGGQEPGLWRKWIGLQVQYLNASIRAQRATLALGQAPALASLVATLLVLGLGAAAIVRGTMSIGDLVAFQVLLAGFVGPLHSLFAATQKLQTLRGDLGRVDDVLRHRREVARPAAAPVSRASSPNFGEKHRIDLEFRDVTFGHAPGTPIVSGFSLRVAPGERVALVGASGSGKSTLARLAVGLFSPWSGEVLVGGRPRQAWPREELAAAIAYVDQDIALFEGSVRDNLTLWRDAPDERLHAALRDAALADGVFAGPGALDARIEEGGRNLSGGQRQRLDIARALVADPAILVLDEATSALDPVAEARVVANLRARGTTCLVVAHRLSTIRDCDRILVLAGGCVVEEGTHAVLAAIAGGHYAALLQSEDAA